MKAFIDTSTLFKKYLYEKGSEELLGLLKKVSLIIVSPITLIESHSIINRLVQEKNLTGQEAVMIKKELSIDFNYFDIVKFNETLQEKSLKLLSSYRLRSLDSIQLASGILSEADVVVTSDSNLCYHAKKEKLKVEFI